MLKEIVKVRSDALVRKPFRKLCKAHCELLLNNLCEVSNRQLLDGRDVTIITYLEFIREYRMKSIVNVKNEISKSKCPLIPAATVLFDAIKNEVAFYMEATKGKEKSVNELYSQRMSANGKLSSARKIVTSLKAIIKVTTKGHARRMLVDHRLQVLMDRKLLQQGQRGPEQVNLEQQVLLKDLRLKEKPICDLCVMV
ncbi:hypothetical protein Tco_0799871 [Tanacetum coccineum]|uniref:Uncharacterized protein n=1 Tax=Tanacetum coccineum TaxID=301880 RepID=A0ABQ4ZVY4_9ASTR